MFQLINDILTEFRTCFKRDNMEMVCSIVLGFMIRSDQRGITLVISSMRLKPRLYHTMLHFYRSTAYKTGELYNKWIKLAIKHGTVVQVAGRVVLLGDQNKVSKEGLRMPSIQRSHACGNCDTGKEQYSSIYSTRTTKRKKRGQPRKYGKKIVLYNFFLFFHSLFLCCGLSIIYMKMLHKWFELLTHKLIINTLF